MSQLKQSWKSPDDMTARQWNFVAEYAKSGNAADAARKAGYATKSARKTGSRLLTYRYIRQALKYYTVEQITQCKRPLRKALRNLERQEIKDWDLRRVQKLLGRLVDLVEPQKTLHSEAKPQPENNHSAPNFIYGKAAKPLMGSHAENRELPEKRIPMARASGWKRKRY